MLQVSWLPCPRRRGRGGLVPASSERSTVPGQGAGTSELRRPRSRLLPLVNPVVLDKPFDGSTSSSPRLVRWSHGNPFCGNS